MRNHNQIEQLNILFGRCGEVGQTAPKELSLPDTSSLVSPSIGRREANAHGNAANTLTRQIIRFIQRHGGQAERIAIMGKPQRVAGRIQWVRSAMTVGTADISATIQGRSVKIEVKIGSDRQSEAQRNYQRQIEAAGGIYYIAKDYESFIEWYKERFENENENENEMV